MEYDFIVGFTLFTPKGFKTMYRHFDKLDTAKMFVSNVNIKDNSKIYVDLKYMQDKIKAKIEEVEQWELYNMKIPRLSTLDERLGAKIGIKYVLQSLLKEKLENEYK